MHLQSPARCNIFGATSSTIVTFSTKSINSTFPKSICSLKHGQENHNFGCFGEHSCPPELFQKNRHRGGSQNYFGHGVGFICALSTKLRVLYTREKISGCQFKNLSFVFRVKDGSPSPFWAWRIHFLQQIRLSHLLLY